MAKQYKVGGKMLTLTEIAAMLQINRNTLVSRLWRTGSIEKAMREGNHCRFNGHKPATYLFGDKLRTVSQIAADTGFSERAVYQRIARIGIQPGDDVSLHFKDPPRTSSHAYYRCSQGITDSIRRSFPLRIRRPHREVAGDEVQVRKSQG